ncbi:MAG TPA: ECF-type sigma factor [Bryobacteraceae bacterium]|nr:ECF-type sigma factor [Bryobacteraceae bacterium]
MAGDITQMLGRMRAGDPAASVDLMPAVYDQLRKLAHRHMRRERVNHVLQPTALVNEAFLKLNSAAVNWSDRVHFFAVASTVMRRVLVDQARASKTSKRGAGVVEMQLSDAIVASTVPKSTDILALHEALEALAKFNPRQARVVEMMFFGGMQVAEVADALGVSEKTVKRDWAAAKVFLSNFLAR